MTRTQEETEAIITKANNLFEKASKELLSKKIPPSLQYALSYVRAGIGMTNIPAIHAQLLYSLTNMNYWRGGTAIQWKEEARSLIKIIERRF